ncbi:uncharacterized protein LOC112572233 [Pomacea canaliculata]|uniref:uncharacterized protein LOC112572233 n=1 Tax=Pomacea canaliculata TaxID=400727 RepID=UPI000D736B09|nr:uncharacterized protein LOC112572233 [Pomacea canaliculata]
MELALLGTVFLLLALAANPTLAATNVGVGSPCSAADTCVTGAVCDRVYAKCLLTQGQECSGENANNCVSGAYCLTTCECEDDYTAVSNLCEPANSGTGDIIRNSKRNTHKKMWMTW